MIAKAARSSGALRGFITVSIMLATVMQVLDTTIANVALPHMQGSLSATQDILNFAQSVSPQHFLRLRLPG